MSNSKLSPQEVFNNKKLFSHKIHAQVLKVIKEISTHIEKFEISNDTDKKLFLNAVNYYYHDLTEVIFHLRQVVNKLAEDDPSISDFCNVLTELNKLVFPIQGSLNLEIGELKIKLESNVIAVGSQVEELMKIVKFDNLHEYKQKALDCQLDLLLSTECLKLHIQHSNRNPIELERMIHDILEKVKNNIVKLQTDHDFLAEDFSHYTRHTLQHLQNLNDYMRKQNNTEKFESNIRNSLNDIDVMCNPIFTDLLEATHCSDPLRKTLEVIDNCQKLLRQILANIQKVFQAGTEKNIGEKGNDAVKELIIHLFMLGIKGWSAWNLCIENAILMK